MIWDRATANAHALYQEQRVPRDLYANRAALIGQNTDKLCDLLNSAWTVLVWARDGSIHKFDKIEAMGKNEISGIAIMNINFHIPW